MKKENRKMAQEKRANARAQAEQRKKRKKILSYAIPITILVILVLVIIIDTVRNSSSSSSDTESTTTEATAAEETTSAEDTTAAEDTADDTESETALNYSTDSSLTVEDGDTVNIDYVGSIDGIEFDGGSTDGAGADLTIGSNSYIDDFEEQLIGYHPGDEVDVTVTFPENYGVDDLNGKEALFKVTINGIYRN